MLRKTIVAIAAAASIGGAVALTATEASARHGGFGGGFHHGGHFAFHHGGMRVAHFHHFGRFHRFHRFGFRRFAFAGGPNYAYGGSCWRWVPTRWGWRRHWYC
jgi:hypothetical protein